VDLGLAGLAAVSRRPVQDVDVIIDARAASLLFVA
jgi:hypothetical protein